MAKITRPLAGCVALSVIVGLVGSSGVACADDFPLAGTYTQNVPCKGDGRDPAEVKVKISAEQIDSRVGVCKFLGVKQDGNNVNARVECQFASGPLMSEVTFTMRPDHTVAFIDRNKTYSAVLYRCPQ